MRAVFIETSEFTEWVSEHLPDDVYSQLQQTLMEKPDAGVVMPGCGGLRKIRVADPRRGKGKRGGARVVYLFVPDVRQFYLLDAYGKDEQDDLSADEKRDLARFAELLVQTARASRDRRSRKKS